MNYITLDGWEIYNTGGNCRALGRTVGPDEERYWLLTSSDDGSLPVEGERVALGWFDRAAEHSEPLANWASITLAEALALVAEREASYLASVKVSLWRAEFGPGYQVPGVITDEPGIEDISWRNDVAPSFTFASVAELGTTDLRLWVEHPDPAEREAGPRAPRYSVMFDDDECYSGDDVNAALENLRRNRDAILRRHHSLI